MAISFVAGSTGFTGNDTEDAIGLPSGIQTNDIVVIVISSDAGSDGTTDNRPVSGQGWNNIVDITDGLPSTWVGYKIMGGTPDSSVTVHGGPTASGSVIAMAAYRGVDTASPIAVANANASGTSGTPNPPNLTGLVAGQMSVAWGTFEDDVVSSNTAPTNWSDLVWLNNGTTNSCSASMIASRLISSDGAYDPGTFATGGSDGWDAGHFSLAPGSSAQNITGAIYSDSDTFNAATVSRGTVTITGAIYQDGDTFNASSVASEYEISGAIHIDTDTFGASVVAPGSINVGGGLFVDGDSYHMAALVTSYGIDADVYADIDSFDVAVISSSYSVQAAILIDPDSFENSTVATAYTISGAIFSDSDIVYGATVSQGGSQVIEGVLYNDTDVILPATISSLSIISGSIHANQNAFQAATISYPISVSVYNDTDQIYGATIGSSYAVSGAAFSDADSFAAATVSTLFQIAASRLEDADSFKTATVAGGASNIAGALFLDVPDMFYGTTISGGVSSSSGGDRDNQDISIGIRLGRA